MAFCCGTTGAAETVRVRSLDGNNNRRTNGRKIRRTDVRNSRSERLSAIDRIHGKRPRRRLPSNRARSVILRRVTFDVISFLSPPPFQRVYYTCIFAFPDIENVFAEREQRSQLVRVCERNPPYTRDAEKTIESLSSGQRKARAVTRP